MSNLDDLKKAHEEANAKAVKLSGEYQEKLDKQVTKKWQELKERYTDRIAEANREARDAQKAWLDAQVIESLKDRPGGDRLAWDLVGQGGLDRKAVEEAFPKNRAASR